MKAASVSAANFLMYGAGGGGRDLRRSRSALSVSTQGGGGLSPAFVFSILIKSPLVAVANGTGLSVVHFYSYLIFQRTQYRGGENARSIGKICSKPGLIGLHAPTVADKIDLHCTQCIA